MMPDPTISVVTPTLRRPDEVRGLLVNLSEQDYLPTEVIFVDGAPEAETQTQRVVAELKSEFPFEVIYIRHGGGTAIQRNVGVDAAGGDLIAFIDDDVRLEVDFFTVMVAQFLADAQKQVGGIVGYRTNAHFTPHEHKRWIWYRKLGMYSTFEPGRYDYETGYPVNANLQPPFQGVREVDFMTTACAVWRREVVDAGLRFDPFFKDFGVLEDAHFSLRAGTQWKLLQCGDAHCVHLKSSGGRENNRSVARKTAVNYRYVFVDIVPDRTARQEFRFWRVQVFDLIRFVLAFFRQPNKNTFATVLGKCEGIIKAIFI